MATSAELQIVIGAVDNTGKVFSNVSKSFQKVGKELVGIGAQMSLATAPIVAAGAASVKSSINFESAFAGVRKTVDATEEEFQKLSKGMREMAKQMPASASEIAKVGEAAGQLGIKTKSILSFTKTMIDLGESTNLSADQAATALARFANITRMSQDDFDRLGSVIVELGNNFATTEAEIVEMGLRLAGAGKQIGLTEAQIMGLAGALSSVGIEAQAGGSAFSRLMVSMQLAVETGNEDLQNFAKVAGMSASQFQKAFREDAGGALITFIEGLGKSEERGISAIKVLDDMGITEIRLRDALLRASGASDVFKESLEMGTEAWKDNTALTEEANKRYKTTESQIEILKNKITDLGIELGDLLTPIIRDYVIPALEKLKEKLGTVINWFKELDPGWKKVILGVAGALVAIGPALMGIGTAMMFVNAIVSASKITWIIMGIVAAIMALTAIGIALWKNWDKIWNSIKSIITTVWESIKSVVIPIVEGIADFIMNVWEGVKNGFTFIWEVIKAIFLSAWSIISSIVGTFVNIITAIIDVAWQFIKMITTTVWNAIYEVIKTIWNAIVGFITPIIEGIKETISTVWNTIKSVTETVWNAIVGFITPIIEGIKNVITTTWDTIKSVTETVWNAISGFFSGIWDSISGFFTERIENIKNNVTNAWNKVSEITTNVWNSIKSAINAPIEAATKFVKEQLDKIKGFFDKLNIKFPHIKLPHFSIKGEFSLSPPKVPYLGVDWYQKGGIFNRPSIIGVGEAGPEAVVPLNKAGLGNINITVTGNTFMGIEDFAEQIDRILMDKLRYNLRIAM